MRVPFRRIGYGAKRLVLTRKRVMVTATESRPGQL